VTQLTIKRGSAALLADSGRRCRSCGPLGPVSENFVQEVAQIFCRIRDHLRDQRPDRAAEVRTG
jgi:hypothetical protein